MYRVVDSHAARFSTAKEEEGNRCVAILNEGTETAYQSETVAARSDFSPTRQYLPRRRLNVISGFQKSKVVIGETVQTDCRKSGLTIVKLLTDRFSANAAVLPPHRSEHFLRN